MTSIPIVSRLWPYFQGLLWRWRVFSDHHCFNQRPGIDQLAQNQGNLPHFVQQSPAAMRYLHLLGPIVWRNFPERDLQTKWGIVTTPYVAFAAACLIKLDQQKVYMSDLRDYLIDHPALVWLLGFPLVPSSRYPWGFDVDASLPTHRHFTRLLRKMPNACLQFLLDETVRLLQLELSTEVDDFGQAISLDTKHILAWVAENNPKAYVKCSDRLDKTHQPKGDPDCKLGCKRKRNQPPHDEDSPTTPTKTPIRSTNFSANDEYFWGYGSGVVATKIPEWCEITLAELTLTFDHSDFAYFFPLMAATERRLSFRPHFGALDAAFDAFYVHEYFHSDLHQGFAAVPFVQRGGHKRSFDPQGLPLCSANLPMPLKSTYHSKKGLVEHQCGRYACPLRFPQTNGQSCPINHKQWNKGGCITSLPTSIGARLRYQLDRQSPLYKEVYKQRTATERINAQAKELGIERPRLRNQQAIANLNTLIYVLINLRALHRVRQKKARQP